ncbi:MarR family winged helix-turn-helix transcriptional regulator [Streptomyces xiaopingdaonensis]|uniref:MarR family winged helix-turn-helix transcriptional regulator n=1 Tax=Streptomyces xiaopingdaonensis TaxID=1565415 RepID=UPI0002F9162A|nr:MarR family winged helix-turn-helix transcriptional regulator [Streptomyces xiaopingdaonensis]
MVTSEERGRRGPQEENGAGLPAFAVQLRRVNGEINRTMHAFAPEHGLHATDVQALSVVLDAEGPVTPGLLRERLGLTSGAVSACLDRLERAGHIRRLRDDADRRVVRIEYAAGARAAARTHFRPLAEATERAHGRFSEDELAVVLRYLTTLNEELAEVRTEPR